MCAPGMYAESALGTLISLQLSGALREPLVPAEQSFYLMMREQILREPLQHRRRPRAPARVATTLPRSSIGSGSSATAFKP